MKETRSPENRVLVRNGPLERITLKRAFIQILRLRLLHQFWTPNGRSVRFHTWIGGSV